MLPAEQSLIVDAVLPTKRFFFSDVAYFLCRSVVHHASKIIALLIHVTSIEWNLLEQMLMYVKLMLHIKENYLLFFNHGI